MSQFIDIEHANESYRNAMKRYLSDREKINGIRKKVNNGEVVDNEDIMWLCNTAEFGIRQEESSWFDHG